MSFKTQENMIDSDAALNLDSAESDFHKTYLLCEGLEKYIIKQAQNSTIDFQAGILPHINRSLDKYSIYFQDEQPRDKHQFASPSTMMLVLVVPSDYIICVDGNLTVKRDKLSTINILGVYPDNNSDNFLTNNQFSEQLLQS